jgi:asparagine synthetase B (glutamine-hydrolysing)
MHADEPYASLHSSALGLRQSIGHAVASLPRDSVLLLSGGIDSSALAAATPFQIRSVTWTTPKATKLQNEGSDLFFAVQVAHHLKLPHTILTLSPEKLRTNVDAAILLGEVKRGTLVDDLVVYIEIARALRKEGVRTVVIGEAADDALGCLPFNLRLLQGQTLLDKLRLDYLAGATADHAAISKTFAAFGIEVVDPYLSATVADVVARIPLEHRVDQKRLMKPALRLAFRDELPEMVVRRHKQVSRDASGVRILLAERYGTSRERFLPIYDRIFRSQNAVETQQDLLSRL